MYCVWQVVKTPTIISNSPVLLTMQTFSFRLSRPTLGPTQPPVRWVPGLYWGLRAAGCDTDPSPPSSAVFKKEYSYTSTYPMGHTACTEPQCLYNGALYLFSITSLDIWYMTIILSHIIRLAGMGLAVTQIQLLATKNDHFIVSANKEETNKWLQYDFHS